MDPSENTADFSRLDEVIAAYLRAEESGEQPDREQWLLRHADMAESLRAFFADRQRFEQAALPLRDALAQEGDPTDQSSDVIVDDGSGPSSKLKRQYDTSATTKFWAKSPVAGWASSTGRGK